MLNQGALADSGRAVEEQGHRLSVLHLGQGCVKRLEVTIAPEQRRPAPRRGGFRERHLFDRTRQPPDDLPTFGPRYRVAAEQRGAERIEVAGDPRGHRTRRNRVEPLLGGGSGPP